LEELTAAALDEAGHAATITGFGCSLGTRASSTSPVEDIAAAEELVITGHSSTTKGRGYTNESQ
jgi:hypothetical protein